MRKLKIRLFLDAILGAIIIAEMLIQVTGLFVHELLGFSLFILLIAHLALERKWICAAYRGARSNRLRKLNLVKAAISLMLFAVFTAMLVSSLIISTILQDVGFPLAQLNHSGFWTCVHSASAYAICMLTIIHLAVHWAMIFNCFKIPYNPERRYAISVGIGALAGVAIAVLGFNASESISRINKSFESLNGQNDVASLDASNADSSSHEDPAPGERSIGDDNSNEGDLKSESDNSSIDRTDDSSPEAESPQPQETPSPYEGSEHADRSNGICPLCPKQCPLSAPRCSRPYQAGLI